MVKLNKRTIIVISIVIIGIGTSIIFILGLCLPNEQLREIGVPLFITVFLSIFLNFLFKILEKEEDREYQKRKRTNLKVEDKKKELREKLTQVRYALEKGKQKSSPHNRVRILFSYLDERITEFSSVLNDEQFSALEELHSLTSQFSIIGFKNKENIWVSRYYSSDISYLEGHIKEIERMIKQRDFKGSKYTHPDIETNIYEAEQEIIQARRDIDRRKEIKTLVCEIMKHCDALIEDLSD